MGIAMILDSDRTNTYYATIAPVQDATQMPKFLDRAKRGRGALPVMRTYNGVSILYWEPKKFADRFPEIAADPMADEEAAEDQVADAVVGKAAVGKKPKMREYGGYAIAYLPSGYVVAADKLKAVEYLIDAQAGTNKLADVPAFRRMLQDDRYPKSLISGYGNYALFAQSDVIKDSAKAAPLPFSLDSPEYKAGLQLIESIQDRIDGFVWIQPEGLEVQASFHLKQPLPADRKSVV